MKHTVLEVDAVAVATILVNEDVTFTRRGLPNGMSEFEVDAEDGRDLESAIVAAETMREQE